MGNVCCSPTRFGCFLLLYLQLFAFTGYDISARIKKFASPDDAMAFAERGDMSPYLTPPSSPVISEPTVPYPSVSSIQFNKLKRAIEQKVHFLKSSLLHFNYK